MASRPQHGGGRGKNAQEHHQGKDQAQLGIDLFRQEHGGDASGIHVLQGGQDGQAHHGGAGGKEQAADARALPGEPALHIFTHARQEGEHGQGAKGGVGNAAQPPPGGGFGQGQGMEKLIRLGQLLGVLQQADHADHQDKADDHRPDPAQDGHKPAHAQQHRA